MLIKSKFLMKENLHKYMTITAYNLSIWQSIILFSASRFSKLTYSTVTVNMSYNRYKEFQQNLTTTHTHFTDMVTWLIVYTVSDITFSAVHSIVTR